MKKIKVLPILGLLTLLSTTSCAFYSTPKIVGEFDKVQFLKEKAEHHEFTRKSIGEGYSYVNDFYHGSDKNGYFFRLYKNNQLLFEKTNEKYLNASSLKVSENKVYFTLQESFIEGDKIVDISSLCTVDSKGQFNTVYKSPRSSIIVDFEVKNSIWIQEDVPTIKSTLFNLNGSGEVIQTYNLTEYNLISFDFQIIDDGILFNGIKNSKSSVSILNTSTQELKTLFSSEKSLFFDEVSYKDNKLTFEAYESKRNSTLTLYCYSNNILQKRVEYVVPDDYGYYFNSVHKINDKIFIDINVSIKDAPKSFYRRVIYLIFDTKTDKTNVLYLDKQADTTIWNNGNIYIGSYNSKYVEDSNGGDFTKIKIDSIKYQ